MTRKSNDQGRAYEFAYLTVFHEEISKIRPSKININSCYSAAERAWNTLSNIEKKTYRKSALAGVKMILELEPRILDINTDELELTIQADAKGQIGDVRDILISRRGIKWEIGLSVKHNHFAVKHSRLSNLIDFGEKWYRVKCSKQYWDDVNPIFNKLQILKNQGELWSNHPSKENDVYLPLLTAFKNEITRQNTNGNNIPRLLVEYLLGTFDFYKAIGIDSKSITLIESYNLRGTLNKESANRKSGITLPKSMFPSRIIQLDFKPNSKNTLELYLDNGWQFSFRIHNASTKIETSLKFDIQIIGMPITIVQFTCHW